MKKKNFKKNILLIGCLFIFLSKTLFSIQVTRNGGDEISAEFSDRLMYVIQYIKSLDQNWIDPEILLSSVNQSAIIIVDRFFDPKTEEILPDSVQALRAWTVPGLFQLKESFWKEHVYNYKIHNDIVAHELLRSVEGNLYDDSNYEYSRRKLKLNQWNGIIPSGTCANKKEIDGEVWLLFDTTSQGLCEYKIDKPNEEELKLLIKKANSMPDYVNKVPQLYSLPDNRWQAFLTFMWEGWHGIPRTNDFSNQNTAIYLKAPLTGLSNEDIFKKFDTSTQTKQNRFSCAGDIYKYKPCFVCKTEDEDEARQIAIEAAQGQCYKTFNYCTPLHTYIIQNGGILKGTGDPKPHYGCRAIAIISGTGLK